MEINTTSDTSSKSLVGAISEEIDPVLDELSAKYSDCELKIIYAFRCLPDEYKRKTFRRYSKKDNVLCLDITFSEERFYAMSKDEQRHHLSHRFFEYTKESLDKYKLNDLGLNGFIKDLEVGCKKIGWLKDDWEVNLYLY